MRYAATGEPVDHLGGSGHRLVPHVEDAVEIQQESTHRSMMRLDPAKWASPALRLIERAGDRGESDVEPSAGSTPRQCRRGPSLHPGSPRGQQRRTPQRGSRAPRQRGRDERARPCRDRGRARRAVGTPRGPRRGERRQPPRPRDEALLQPDGHGPRDAPARTAGGPVGRGVPRPREDRLVRAGDPGERRTLSGPGAGLGRNRDRSFARELLGRAVERPAAPSCGLADAGRVSPPGAPAQPARRGQRHRSDRAPRSGLRSAGAAERAGPRRPLSRTPRTSSWPQPSSLGSPPRWSC